MSKKYWLGAGIGVTIAIMFCNIFHPFLWGPDEPREAEIARAIYASGNYVTPHFCTHPFVEKPPLYHDLVALAFSLTGGASPEAARAVSAIFGCLMLGVAFWFGKRFFSLRCGIFSLLFLLVMPQFYRASHWILLDIAVGAFIAAAFCALAAFLYTDADKKGRKRLILCLFYLLCAGGFLTKGIIAVLPVAAAGGAYILIRRRWSLIGELLWPPAVLCFLAPVAGWVWLFYQEGGMLYIQEHFVNNTIGRLLHIQFRFAGEPTDWFTDVGNRSPWYFYLQRLPEMFGGVIALIPFVLYEALRRFRLFSAQWIDRSPAWVRRWVAPVLEPAQLEEKNLDISLFLLLWLLVPMFLLSFSAIKEVTYLLSSYPALAILAARWCDERLPRSSEERPFPWWALVGVGACALSAAFVARFSSGFYIGIVIAIMVWMLWESIAGAIRTKRLDGVLFAILAVMLCGIALGNTPELMRKTRLNRKCFLEFAAYVWEQNGDRTLYIFSGDETLRGSIPFYGNRDTVAIRHQERLVEQLRTGESISVIMPHRLYQELEMAPEVAEILPQYEVILPPFPGLMTCFALLRSR